MGTRAYKWAYTTDGTYTLDGSADCFPVNTTITGKAIDCGWASEISIHTKCNDVTTALTCKYEISIDGTEWIDGLVAIANLDNNEIMTVVTDTAVNFIRVVITSTMAAETATVLAVVGRKS